MRQRHWFSSSVVALLFSAATIVSATERPIWNVGDVQTLEGWGGLKASSDGAILAIPGEATFDGGRQTQDVYRTYGLRVELHLPDERPVRIEVGIGSGREDKPVVARMVVRGAGWQSLVLPWSGFDFPKTFDGFLHRLARVSLSAQYEDGSEGTLLVRQVRVIQAERVALTANVRGKSVAAGEVATYDVTVGNCTDQPQSIVLSFDRAGFEAMTATVEPAMLQLEPGATASVAVKVNVPSRVPPGGHEIQTLRAIGNGTTSSSSVLSLTTAARLEHPYILHTKAGWDDVRAKIAAYDWAKEAADDYVARSDKWRVPGVRNPTTPKRGVPLFATAVEHDLMAAGIAYQATLDEQHAEKVRQFLLNLSNPQNGYPITRRGCDQASVQEGHFFQHIAMAYDMAIPSGVFSEADRDQIDQTLRLFVGLEGSFGGNISNWNISYQCGQLYASLILQDLDAANRMLYGRGALIDQFIQGTLNDGWWYEVSISYNTWCATEFSQVAIAMRPWGIDLVNQQFPVSLRPANQKPANEEEYGMSRARWGPIHRNSIGFKAMWDALPGMVDYRGVMFGLNDSTERKVGGAALEIAYYLYRDPAYAAIINRSGDRRNLLYGVPELPDSARADLSKRSTFADNAGVAVMRSQAENRPQREQIQAVLHYGDHGWYHGHFDRTNLVHLSRYGRSFYNPMMIWYGYPNFMYKFYVQTSVNKNMVVVDQKQQEPVESQRLLFHSGKMMQVVAVQSNARWSNPPYGGMRYWDQPHKTFADKTFAEGRSLTIPPDAPDWGAVTDYTEPILQRRLMLVTDDYVVLADYLKGEREHTYESLYQMKGFQGFDANAKLASHAGQWSRDPLGSAQFVTDCDWYDVMAPARGSFQFRWGEGADNAGTRTEQNEPGILNIDLHTLWPATQQIMVGTPPETHDVQKRVFWTIIGDDKNFAEGKFGAWVLGREDVEVAIEGVKRLTLQTRAEGSKLPTLFWANARIVTDDGKEIPLASLPVKLDNLLEPKTAGKDYFGGPIKIVGEPVANAVPAQPQDVKREGTVTVDLGGIRAAKLKVTLGGDFPLGDEAQRRKTVALKVVGREARFLTILEPFEDRRVIRRAEAMSADQIQVELTDGRVQTINIESFTTDDGHRITARIIESKDGQTLRSETTSSKME